MGGEDFSSGAFANGAVAGRGERLRRLAGGSFGFVPELERAGVVEPIGTLQCGTAGCLGVVPGGLKRWNGAGLPSRGELGEDMNGDIHQSGKNVVPGTPEPRSVFGGDLQWLEVWK